MALQPLLLLFWDLIFVIIIIQMLGQQRVNLVEAAMPSKERTLQALKI
uniref:CDPK1 n=1 Tax=Arundo donax TaxID=35708 RepID=A0A0A9CXB5_ARUDO